MAAKAAKAPASLLDALARAGLSGRGLRAALEKCNVSAVRAILSSKPGASLASKSFEDGKWPLDIAIALLGRDGLKPEPVVEIVSSLLERRACPNQASPPLNESPLQIALRMDASTSGVGQQAEASSRWHVACMDIVLLLLESQADPNHTDAMGEGPLAEAAVGGNVDAVRVLLVHGASPSQQNVDGKCPLELDIPANVRQMFETGALTSGSDAAWASDVCTADAPKGSLTGMNVHDVSAEMSAKDESCCAMELFERGNKHFMAQRYVEARACYSKALVKEPGNALFSESKAAACMVLGDFDQAFEEASAAVHDDAENGFVHEQCAKCLLMSNRLQEAQEFCSKRVQQMTRQEVEKPEPEWSGFCVLADRIQQHADAIAQVDLALDDSSKMEVGIGDQALEDCNRTMSQCFSLLVEMLGALSGKAENSSMWAKRLRLSKVRVILFPLARQSRQSEQKRNVLGREACEEAVKLSEDHPGDPDVLYCLACSLLSISRRSEAVEGLRNAISAGKGRHAMSESLLNDCTMAQNHQEEARTAIDRQEYEVALEHLDAALQMASGQIQCLDRDFSADLLCDRSVASQKVGTAAGTKAALDDVTRALELKAQYPKALFQRALLHMELQRYTCAQTDLDKVEKLEPGFSGLSDVRARAKVWASKPPKQNYYAVLGIGFDASADSMKKAYKAAALKWHPDKNPGDAHAEKMFMSVQEAFEVLSDPTKKFEYDGFEREPVRHSTFFGANFGGAGRLNTAQFNGAQFGSAVQPRRIMGSDSQTSEDAKQPAQGKGQDFKGWNFKGASSCHTHAPNSTFTPPLRNDGSSLEGWTFTGPKASQPLVRKTS